MYGLQVPLSSWVKHRRHSSSDGSLLAGGLSTSFLFPIRRSQSTDQSPSWYRSHYANNRTSFLPAIEIRCLAL